MREFVFVGYRVMSYVTGVLLAILAFLAWYILPRVG